MSKLHNQTHLFWVQKSYKYFICLLTLFNLYSDSLYSQCITNNGEISGKVFKDQNLNGAFDVQEEVIPFVQINAYNKSNILVSSSLTNLSGYYNLTGLTDANRYRIEIVKPSNYEYSFLGPNSSGDLKFVYSPACEIHFGLYRPVEVNLNPNPDIAVTIFNNSLVPISSTQPHSIVSLKQKFTSSSTVNSICRNDKTGSIYGLAWNRSKSLLYASSFVKQYSPLGPLGIGGIYSIDDQGKVSTFVDLKAMGINLGSTLGYASTDCRLGSLVGKSGLGNMDISDDDQFLLVTNLFSKSLLIIPTSNPSSNNIIELSIPNPSCGAGDFSVAAVKYYNGNVYLGVTCTGESTKSSMSFHIYELNLLSRVFNLILSTDFAKNYWLTDPGNSKFTSQWLTDIDFNNRGEMIIGISDRKGHTYCGGSDPLTNQEGDILVAYKVGSKWTLERAGYVNGRAGSGVGRFEGPGFGEFFGEDYWIVGPSLHPEVSFGTVATGQDAEVINAVFDPRFESFAGGLHRYNTDNGKMISSIELYNRNNNYFGKASGIGDVELMNESIPIELGNYIWLDQNGNGIQDSDENGIDGIRLILLDQNCKEIGVATTDINGNYLFNKNNVDLDGNGIMDGLKFGETYYIVLNDSRYNGSLRTILINGQELELTASDRSSAGVYDSYDSDAKLDNVSCGSFANYPVVVVFTGNSGQNSFLYDIGLKPKSPVVNPPTVTYDLALLKRVAAYSSLHLNDFVEFSIEVYNQGDGVVDSYEVIDYVPNQFQFVQSQNLDWIADGTNAIYKSKKSIQVGEKQTITIKLKLINVNNIRNIVNIAEISSMRDKNGLVLKDKDSTPDKDETNDAGGQVNSVYDNSVNGNGIDDEDDHDPANLKIYDLALILTKENTNPIRINESRRLQIRVCNQGSEAVRDVKFIHYLPVGLTLSSSDNNGWILQNGKLYNIISQELLPGECATKDILVSVNNYSGGACLETRAEIVSFNDANGINVSSSDLDSKPDEVLGNDAGGVFGSASDNVLTGNGFNDEDDEDPEMLVVADLALKKELRPNCGLKYKGNLLYDITIYNQGCIPLRNISIIDYLAASFELSNESIQLGWKKIDNRYYFNYAKEIVPGASITIPIEVQSTGDIDLINSVNFAEIVGFTDNQNNTISDYDYDSTPDIDPNNDKGLQSGNLTDNVIEDHGILDEDDHDGAKFLVTDLALTNTIVDGSKLFKKGDLVEFKIKIYNQGNTIPGKVEIINYIDKNFTYSQADNELWQLDSDQNATLYISDPIEPGSVKEISIFLKINDGTAGLQIPNIAEISSIEDLNGVEICDYDSQQDKIPTNDKYDGSRTDDHGLLDEDDHDQTTTNPKNFDLSLRKFVNKRVAEIEGEVEWTIQIVNQGTLATTEIEVVDYLPESLTILDPQWYKKPGEENSGKYYVNYSVSNGKLGPEGLLPGDTLRIIVLTKLNAKARPGIITNGAEIFKADNTFSEPDEDSVPDDDDTNDPGGNIFDGSDNSVSAGPEEEGDEDDSDIEGLLYLVIEHSDCFCLNNASTEGDGQFIVDLTLESRNDEEWFIRSVNGLYQASSAPPPASPDPFITGPAGFTLSPITFTGSTTVYGMSGIFVTGEGFDIILENQYGDKVSLGNVRCSYETSVVLESQNNVCSGSTIRYTVQKRPGSEYLWEIGSGGNIVSDPTKNSILVEWTGSVGSTHTLTIKEQNPDLCIEPLNIPVTIGNVGGSVSCIGSAQISLNSNCEATVTAKQLLIGGPYDYDSYAVMIFNKDGSLVPNNTVTYDHVSKSPLMAKVINTCSGNSCWTWIRVEDKLPPVVQCLNDTIDCTRMKSHLGPLVFDNCDLHPILNLLSETIENTPCNPLYSKIVHRKFQAKDASGNLSKICNSDYFLKRIELDSVVFPDSLTLSNHNSLVCGDYPKDSLGRPDPNYTGVPLYHEQSLFPNSDLKYCDFATSFDDYVISTSQCIKKVNRVWKLTIWYCTTFEQRVYNQLIEIRDIEAPVIQCPYDKEVFANSAECGANVYISPISALDSCNNGVNITLTYSGGIVKNFVGGFINLPVGENEIFINASDNCYNQSKCSFNVTVIDNVPPTVQCDKETAISLDRFGRAWVPASVFDDGSYDNCHLKSFKARRMDDGGPCNIDSRVFRDSIEFCCADLDQLVTVMLQVSDESGNLNTCMVQVEVQDKTIPHVTCPHNVTIDCDQHIDLNNLTSFGSAQVSDNCTVTITEVDSISINQCNEGYIDRIFMAGNSFGLDVCTQRISIINDEPFNESNIIWPEDVDSVTCFVDALSPEKLGSSYRPIINEDHCDLVGVNYEDQVFRFVTGSDACFKILRKWRIINWCRSSEIKLGLPLIYEHVQILKAHNIAGPRILSGCELLKFEDNDTSCYGANVVLTSEAEDDCTPNEELIHRYEIDLDSDGRIDYTSSGVGSRIDASGFYKLGTHRVKYIFEDKCGNKTSCENTFEIVNSKLPSAYCKKGVAVGIEPMDLDGNGIIDGEYATIWASDLDQGSNHPCGYDLTLSFGQDSSKHSITFDCRNIGRNTVLLCVTASNGKQDCCETFVEVQDNNNTDLCGCVKRPLDLVISDCLLETDPFKINSIPTVNSCACDSSKVSNTDEIIFNFPGICYRIERNWTVEFFCINDNSSFKFKQIIDVTTNLQESDIQWPQDSVIINDCVGSIDTSVTGGSPHFCYYKGNVVSSFRDEELPPGNNVRVVRRIWNVFSNCNPLQSYFYNQIIIVRTGGGVGVTYPPDITVNDCRKPLLPDSLNGYPQVQCGCDSTLIAYKDDTITTIGEICYLVERNWNVRARCRPQIDTTFFGIQRIVVDINLEANDIIWPADTFKSYTCLVNTSPNRTGRPVLSSDFCNLINIVFNDVVVQNSTCSTIRRTWTVRNTCSASQVFTREQIIINYNQGTINLSCPPNITVNADPNLCGAIVTLVPPVLTSPCNFGISLSNNAPTVFPVGLTNVIYTAVDTCNHIARCTTTVTVVENIPPVINCPNDTTVECSSNLNNLSVFGRATATDNCPGVAIIDSVVTNLNICGIGDIKRFFTATDASGNRTSCLQSIVVNNNDPLDSLEINWPQSPILVPECGDTNPSNTGVPSVDVGVASCFRISVSFKDSSFCVPGNCQINRKWTVLDSCTNTQFMYVQQIKIDDNNAPNILGIKDTSIFANDTTCSGFLNIKAFVDNCDSLEIVITNNSSFGGNGLEDASGIYPEGTTQVTFTATDGCCNVSTKTINITVTDTVAPFVTCKKVHRTIPDVGCVEVHANEFIVMKGDNCTMNSMLMISFSPTDFNDTVRLICCDSLDANREYFKSIKIYIKDKSGNVSSCETLIRVSDPNFFCSNFVQAGISGYLSSRKDQKMAGVPIDLISQSSLQSKSDYNGIYAFKELPMGGTYTLRPTLDIDPLDGVTTYDIVLIQNHILGKKLFKDPYQFIAADVNRTKTITSSDISEIRKLILGYKENFSNNRSWRFINSEYNFIHAENPLSEDFPEEYFVPVLRDNVFVSFKGIKVGDVDDSQKFSGLQEIKSRNSQIVPMTLENVNLKKGEIKSVFIRFDSYRDYLGAQGCIRTDLQKVKIVDLKIDSEGPLSQESIGTQLLSQGLIKFSWIANGSSKDWIINIQLEAIENCNSADLFDFDNECLLSEAYNKNGEFTKLVLKNEGSTSIVSSNTIVLYQNIPNPFSDKTLIPVESLKPCSSVFNVYDINGKRIINKIINLIPGMNYIEVSRKEFLSEGIYIYKIEDGEQIFVRKMILKN
ncbi:MAG: T9SS type A sorting domain-containing protein [Saprospiraceae bacterium]|nr:T9SS type A sorting domain-containing protein [Saprospiraceae bacterium]